MKTVSKLDEMYRECAALCRIAGVPIDGKSCGAIHRWVVKNIKFRPGTEFFIVLGIFAEMADMDAQSQGYDNQFHQAAELAFCNRKKKGGNRKKKGA